MAGDTAAVMDFTLDRVPVAEETQRLETQLVYTASVAAKQVSRVLQFAAKRLPKLEGIEHVKRVKRISADTEGRRRDSELLQVVLCQCNKITRAQLDATVEADTELQMPAAKEEEEGDGPLRITTHRVPSTAPCTHAQFDEWRALWPVAYRPLSQLKPPVFGAQERAYVCRNLELVVRMCEGSRILGIRCAEFVVVASPVTQTAMAKSADRAAVDRHPLRHAVMCCIAIVAETETKKALACCDEDVEEKTQPSDAATTAADPLSSLVPAKRSASSAVSNNEDALSSSGGGYLCEGLDVFASREPCTMCCMALVHSRIGRLFFIEPRKEDGGISYHSIHSLKALNHHFTAFQCTQTK
ncbi:tRNA-specific adenosine deaminase subunit tad3 [Coemansia sp. RSA 2049]|nr:tRNA-specific adenosine deaminase subunit tad3 [Coemansia sp. RSA 2049]